MRKLGIIKVSAFISEGGGPVETGSSLTCDFEFGSQCCWANSQPPADTLDWKVATKPPDQAKYDLSFGANSPPPGKLVCCLPKTCVFWVTILGKNLGVGY